MEFILIIFIYTIISLIIVTLIIKKTNRQPLEYIDHLMVDKTFATPILMGIIFITSKKYFEMNHMLTSFIGILALGTTIKWIRKIAKIN